MLPRAVSRLSLFGHLTGRNIRDSYYTPPSFKPIPFQDNPDSPRLRLVHYPVTKYLSIHNSHSKFFANVAPTLTLASHTPLVVSSSGERGTTFTDLIMPSPSSTPSNTIRHLDPDSKHAISGACAGLLTSLVMCPLEVVKTRFQAQINSVHHVDRGGIAVPSGELYRGINASLKRIWVEEGIRGLYRGLGPVMVGNLPTWTVYFPVYEHCKMFYAAPGRPEYQTHILSAMTAGATTAVATNPIWVVKTRLMTQSVATPYHYRSTLDCVIRIMREEGPRTFYSGLLPSLIGVSHVVVQFPALEYLKHVLSPPDTSTHASQTGQINPQSNHLPLGRFIVAIIISKALASSATYPHEVIRTRLQNQPGGKAGRDAKYKGLWHAFRTILREEGARGLYGGFGVNLVRTVPSSVVTILGFEAVKSWLGD